MRREVRDCRLFHGAKRPNFIPTTPIEQQFLGKQRLVLDDTYLGLMTPKIAAAIRIQKFSNRAKMTPLITINADPRANTALLPMESATRVRKKLITTSPARVKVMNRPMRSSGMSSEDK